MRPAGTVTHCELVVEGAIEPWEVERTLRSVGRVLRCHRIGAPSRLRLSAAACPDGPVLAQVNTRFREIPVRVQVGGPTGFLAEFVAERLDRQIARIAAGDVARVWPDPARPALAAVTEPRPVVRRKYCELRRGDPRSAATAMDAMDYDAHLFSDAETGEDAAVYWAGPHGVRLARQRRVDPPRSNTLPLSVNPRPALLLTDAEAGVRLCRYGLPFVFFTDPRDKRGRLLYRRYDGDLALVAPAPTDHGGA